MKQPSSRFNLIKLNSVQVLDTNRDAVLVHIIAENELGEEFINANWMDKFLYNKLQLNDQYTITFFLDMISSELKEKHGSIS